MSGHIFDMINRIAQNKIPRRKKFKGNNREHLHSEKLSNATEYDFPNVSRTDLNRIKQTIRQGNKMENRKALLYFIVCLVLVALIAWMIISFYDLNKYSQF